MQAWSLAPPQPHFSALTAGMASSIRSSQRSFSSLDISPTGAAPFVPAPTAPMPSKLSVSLAPQAQMGMFHRQGVGAPFLDWSADDGLDAFLQQPGL
jgi:hypothetical protein